MNQAISNTNSSPNSVASSNIVATAMSSANLAGSPVRITLASSPGPVSSPQNSMAQRLSPMHPSNSIQSPDNIEMMNIPERVPSADGAIQQHGGGQQQVQESQPMMIERENDKIVVISESHSMKDSSSPLMSTGSPIHTASEGSAEHMSANKDRHMVSPSPAHTPQPPPQESTAEHGVRALVVYNERGEQVMDPILQLVPNQPREESTIMKDESYPITCGNSKAELYWKKFICPGINAKCVRCGNVWMTPKEFVQEAGKSTLKDWKRAIRINGTMLRKMIESGEVDYYQHDQNCSNQCRSNKGASLEATSSRESFNHSFDTADSREQSMSEGGPTLERSSSEDISMLTTKHAMMTVQRISQDSQKSAMSSLERSSSEDSGLAPSPQLDGVMRDSIATPEKLQDLQKFWSGIVHTDLFDEVVQDVITQVTTIQRRAKSSPVVSAEDAVMMMNLANALDLIPAIVQKMTSHKMTVERQAEQSTHVIQELERKLAEQRRYDQDLKRKSQHLESVINLTPNEKRKKKNMVRLFRQKAIDSRTLPPNMPQPGPSSSSSRLPTASDMVGVVPIRFPPHELWVPQASTAVAHALQQVASNQMARMNVSGQIMSMPIPPHLLSHDNFHQDTSKK